VNLLVINLAVLQSDPHMIHILDHAHPVYVLYIDLDSILICIHTVVLPGFCVTGAQVWHCTKTENKCIPYHPRQHSILPNSDYALLH